jgi:hypothetical protein
VASNATRKAAETARFQNVSLAGARNVGQRTPADMVQTFIWALVNGDTNQVMQLVECDAEPQVEKILAPTFALIKEQLTGAVNDYGCTGFQVQGDQPTENDDRWMRVDLISTNGPIGDPGLFRIRQTAAGWKLLISAQGMPVTQEAGK